MSYERVFTGQSNAISNYDTSSLFLKYPYGVLSVAYTNGEATAVTLNAGTLMGIDPATGQPKPVVSTATDGSQRPRGFLADTYDIEPSATVILTIANNTVIDENNVVLSGSETLKTIVTAEGMSIEGCLEAFAYNCTVKKVKQLSKKDNQ